MSDSLFEEKYKGYRDYYIQIMSMYSSNAKNYVQISVGALILPITFYREISGNKDGQIVLSNWLVLSWVSFLLAIGSGLFYQYLAVKRIEYRFENIEPWKLIRRIVISPGYIYFIMLVTFYLGSIFFLMYAFQQFHVL